MSGAQPRLTRDDALGDALKRIRVLERISPDQKMPWIFTQTDITGVTVNNGVELDITHNGLEVAPLNRGGSVDEDVFDWSPPTTEIGILTGGLYLIAELTAWFGDWGKAFSRVIVGSTGPPGPAAPVIEIIGSFNTADQQAPQSWPGGGHQQILLKYWGIWTIDPDVEGCTVKSTIFNLSGANRTYAAASPNPNLANLTIIRLAPSGASNPFA